MKVFRLALFAVLAVPLISSGCVPLVIGAAAGGAGVYAASRDTIQGDTDVGFETLWDAAVTVTRVRGTIVKQDFDKGTIEACEGKSIKIWVTLEKLTASTTRLKVASRKYKMPNLELAQTIYTKILDETKNNGTTVK